MTVRARVTSKGQITIPQEVRRRLGLKQGDQVEFVTEDGVTVIRPAKGEVNPFAAYAGVLGSFDTKEAVNSWIDDLRSEANDG
jgi:antitoxin PrlF